MKYRNKPFMVDAVQWIGNNIAEVEKLAGKKITTRAYVGSNLISMAINVERGQQELELGDYIIKSEEGKFYICNPHDFEIIYEEVKE